MTPDLYLLVIFWLTLAGTLFAGYLSMVRLITQECALNRPCPYFLGVPACWFGFAMFLAMFTAALLTHIGYGTVAGATMTFLWISLLGTLFSGVLTLKEVFAWAASTETGKKLVLSSCAYGLVFFVIIFILSLYQ